MTAREEIQALRLFDHHCHGIVSRDLTWRYFTSLLTEADVANPELEFDSQLGAFVLTECAQSIGLTRHCEPQQYWERRQEIGNVESSKRLISAAGITHFGLDTGYRGNELTTPQQLADLTQEQVSVISRLETMAEQLIGSTSAQGFPDAFRSVVQEAAKTSIGFKSVMAYRFGLDFDPERPSDQSVADACRRWISRIEQTNTVRADDETILRFLLWSAVDLGMPIQMHIGYGDTDITLYRCDPSRMTEFLRLTEKTGASIVLLHCYPYVRQAAILCQVFSHVWMDTSLGVPHAGYASTNIIRESLEMAPFSRVLFASDAFGLAEIYLAGASLWRRGMTSIVDEWLAEDTMTRAKALDITARIAFRNGLALYGIEGDSNAS